MEDVSFTGRRTNSNQSRETSSYRSYQRNTWRLNVWNFLWSNVFQIIKKFQISTDLVVHLYQISSLHNFFMNSWQLHFKKCEISLSKRPTHALSVCALLSFWLLHTLLTSSSVSNRESCSDDIPDTTHCIHPGSIPSIVLETKTSSAGPVSDSVPGQHVVNGVSATGIRMFSEVDEAVRRCLHVLAGWVESRAN